MLDQVNGQLQTQRKKEHKRNKHHKCWVMVEQANEKVSEGLNGGNEDVRVQREEEVGFGF